MDAVLKAAIPHLQGGNLHKLVLFVDTASHLKNEIMLVQRPTHEVTRAPKFIPSSVVHFLADVCRISRREVKGLWKGLRKEIWSMEPRDDESTRRLFLAHGTERGFPYQHALWPPVSHCTNPHCTRAERGRKLQVAESSQGVLYTLASGPVPIYAVNLRCKDCSTVYTVDYLHQGGQRQYYDNPMPDILQLSNHQYAERKLIQMWRILTNQAWVSSANCAATYKETFAPEIAANFPPNWQFQVSLSGKHVSDGFTLESLLRHCSRSKTVLLVPHSGEQSQRFVSAMRQRNEELRLLGQPHLGHRCSKCVRIYPATDTEPAQQVHAVVMDGITLGRPTCGHPHCPEPLENPKKRYCPSHAHEANLCAVLDCRQPVEEGFQTCQDAIHRKVEDAHNLRTKGAQFQLKGRLERARVAHPKSASALDIEVDEIVGQEDGEIETFELNDEGSPTPVRTTEPTQSQEALATVGRQTEDILPLLDPVPGKKIRAKFTRTRTHNEQIINAPCGMIACRETFLVAEGMHACAKLIERTYPDELPNQIIFDNNCHLQKHIESIGPDGLPNFPRLAGKVGFAVDVFHYKCKHSRTDEYCKNNCNPDDFPELKGEHGKAWYFNTSIAEQTNVWLGGYHAIVREMSEEKYDFFLDEMILMRNELTLCRLLADENVVVYS